MNKIYKLEDLQYVECSGKDNLIFIHARTKSYFYVSKPGKYSWGDTNVFNLMRSITSKMRKIEKDDNISSFIRKTTNQDKELWCLLLSVKSYKDIIREFMKSVFSHVNDGFIIIRLSEKKWGLNFFLLIPPSMNLFIKILDLCKTFEKRGLVVVPIIPESIVPKPEHKSPKFSDLINMMIGSLKEIHMK